MAAERNKAMGHVLRLYENPLKQVVYIPGSLLFAAIGLVFIRASRPTPVGVFLLALGCLSVAFFGLGGVALLISVGYHLVRPRLVLQVDARGWTSTPAGLRWTQHVAWQDVSRVALQSQRVRSKHRFLLVWEEDRLGEAAPAGARGRPVNASAPSDPVVLFVELNDLFLRVSPGKALGLLERIRTEFAAELDRHGITVANTIEDRT
jgi:hypothetical protein